MTQQMFCGHCNEFPLKESATHDDLTKTLLQPTTGRSTGSKDMLHYYLFELVVSTALSYQGSLQLLYDFSIGW